MRKEVVVAIWSGFGERVEVVRARLHCRLDWQFSGLPASATG
jgi:hypothetical protein